MATLQDSEVLSASGDEVHNPELPCVRFCTRPGHRATGWGSKAKISHNAQDLGVRVMTLRSAGENRSLLWVLEKQRHCFTVGGSCAIQSRGRAYILEAKLQLLLFHCPRLPCRASAQVQEGFLTYTVYDDVITMSLIQEACRILGKSERTL